MTIHKKKGNEIKEKKEIKRDYHRIVKYINKDSYTFVIKDGIGWLDAKAIAKLLGLKDYRNVHSFYTSNKEVLEPYRCVIDSVTQNYERRIAIFSSPFFRFYAMNARTDQAKEVQKEVLRIWDDIDRKGYYVKDGVKINPIELVVKEAQQIAKLGLHIIQIEDKVNNLEDDVIDVKDIQEKICKSQEEINQRITTIEENRPITTETKRQIRDMVHNTVVFKIEEDGYVYEDIKSDRSITGKYWGEAWSHLSGTWEFSSYKELTEKKAQKILNWMKDDDFFMY